MEGSINRQDELGRTVSDVVTRPGEFVRIQTRRSRIHQNSDVNLDLQSNLNNDQLKWV